MGIAGGLTCASSGRRCAPPLNRRVVRRIGENTIDADAIIAEFGRCLRAGGATVRAGASAATLESFEQKYDAVLPSDTRAFYLAVDGMDDDCPFESFIRVLPIGEINPVCDEFPDDHPRDAFIIGDWSLGAHFYAIDLLGTAGPAGAVYLAHDPPLRVASTFADFVHKVLRDSPELFQGEGTV